MTTIAPARPSLASRSTPSRPVPSSAVPARRVGLIDRAALQIGIALVHWSRRSAVAVHHERRALRVEQQRERERRERQHVRLALTLTPLR